MNDKQVKELGGTRKANVEVKCVEKAVLRPYNKGTIRDK